MAEEISDDLKIQYAQHLAFKAYSDVEKTHNSKSGNAKGFADALFRDMYRYEKKTTVAKLLTAGAFTTGTIIATVSTGGLALGILGAIAAGKYSISKLVDEFSKQKQKKRLLRYMDTSKGNATEMAKNKADLMAEDVCKAFPKSRLHLQYAKETAEKLKLESAPMKNHCQDAIDYLYGAINFTHHLQKARGYLIPCLVLIEDMLEKYVEFSDEWSKDYKTMEKNLVEYAGIALKEHDSDRKRFKKNPEEHSQLKGDTGNRPDDDLAKDHGSYSGSSGKHNFGEISTRTLMGKKESSKSLDIKKVKEDLEEKTNQFLSGIEKYRNLGFTGNYKMPSAGQQMTNKVMGNHAYKQTHVQSKGNSLGFVPNQVAVGVTTKGLFSPSGAQMRYKRLIADVYRNIENPGKFKKSWHRIKNWRKSTGMGEKLGGAAEEGLTMGVAVAGVFLSDLIGKALKGASVLANKSAAAGKSAGLLVVQKGGTTGASWVTFRLGSKAVMMESGLLTCDENERKKIMQDSDPDLSNSTKVVSDKLIKKVCHHFKKAVNARKKVGSQDLTLHAYACQIYEVHHHMDKMERYLMACLTLVILLMDEVDSQSAKEKQIHDHLDNTIAPFVYAKISDRIVGDHPLCREYHTKCYGPKSEDMQQFPRNPL